MPTRSKPVDTDDLVARRQLWPLAEAAERLGLSRTTLWRRSKAGAIRVVRVGARTYVSEAEIQRFIANLEAAAS